jgi:hypothetical protein
MDDGSHNGHAGDHEESAREHRSSHYLNLLDESITLLVEDAEDDDAIDGVVDSVLLALVDIVAGQGFRPPRALMGALATWVGTDDPRPYLRSVYADKHGRLADDTPEQISRYLRETDDEFWPDE